MKTEHQTKIRAFARLILGVGGASLTTFAAEGANLFSSVAAGDASSVDAILLTRCLDANAPAVVSLTAQVSTDPALGFHDDFSLNTDPAKDYAVKVVAA